MKHYDYLTGYKATDKDMKCKGTGDGASYEFQFELGKWYKHEGQIKLCNSGFHFCLHPSGPWQYYNARGTRIFKVEARDVYEEYEPGAALKVVCGEIRLIEEITPTGSSNTGSSNTGNWNTGDSNTGSSNTGSSNTGNWNTGNWNTGYRNTGYSNTGSSNTGNWNTGDSNTGSSNTGNWNTGDSNTGNSNTGNWNSANHCAGFFCIVEPKVLSFDIQTDLTHDKFLDKYPQAYRLGELLSQDEPFDYGAFSDIPGCTPQKCETLHKQHIAKRVINKKG